MRDKNPYSLYTLADLEDVAEKSYNSALRAVRDALDEFYKETDSGFAALEDVLDWFEEGGRFEVKDKT